MRCASLFALHGSEGGKGLFTFCLVPSTTRVAGVDECSVFALPRIEGPRPRVAMKDPLDLPIARLLKSPETLNCVQSVGEGGNSASCGVCGKSSSSGTVELSKVTLVVFLEALLVNFKVDERQCHLEACISCCSAVLTLVDLFRQLEELQKKFNRLRRKLGRLMILKSLGIQHEIYAGWVEVVKTVEDVFPSRAKIRLRRTKNEVVGTEEENVEAVDEDDEEFYVKEEVLDEYEDGDGVNDDWNDDFETCAVTPPADVSAKEVDDAKLSKMRPVVMLSKLKVTEAYPMAMNVVSHGTPENEGSEVTSANKASSDCPSKREETPKTLALRIQRPFKCRRCPKRFTSEFLVNRHYRNKHNSKVRPARYKRRTLKSQEASEGTEEMGCSHCDLKFGNLWVLQMHQLRSHLLAVPGALECQYCKQWCMDEWTLEEHLELMHSVLKNSESENSMITKETLTEDNQDDKKAEKIHCSMCRGLLFSSVEELEIHVRSDKHQEILKEKTSCYCNLCRLHFGNEIEVLQSHLKSEDHLKVVNDLENFNKDTFCIPCRLECASSKELATHNNSKQHRDGCWFRTSGVPKRSKLNKKRILSKPKYEVERLKKPEKCPICKMTIVIAGKLENHMKVFHNEEGYTCDICKIHFAYLRDFKSHMELHDGCPYICDKCGKGFTGETNLKTHYRNIHKGKSSKCLDCGKLFPSNLTLKNHTRNMHSSNGNSSGTRRTCGFCSKMFKLGAPMRRHCYEMHKTEYMKDFEHACLVCYLLFPTADALNDGHMAIHESVKCKVCGKYYQSKSLLSKHVRSHTGEKPYTCTFCDKKFSNQTNMKDHMLRHKGDTPFACETCGKRFVRMFHLKRHKKQMGH